jgi:hypothetical protein
MVALYYWSPLGWIKWSLAMAAIMLALNIAIYQKVNRTSDAASPKRLLPHQLEFNTET